MGETGVKFEIKPEGTLIAKAAGLSNLYSNFLFKLAFSVIWAVGILSIFVLVTEFFQFADWGAGILGISYFLLALALIYWAKRAFYFDKLKYPESISLPDMKEKVNSGKTVNLFSLFSLDLARATKDLFLKQSEKISSKELALALLSSRDLDFILLRLGIGKDKLQKDMKKYEGGVEASKIILESLDFALKENHCEIMSGDVFCALCEKDSFSKELISDLNLKIGDIVNVCYWQDSLFKRVDKDWHFLDTSRFKLSGGIGKDWAFGWTPYLKQFSVDITEWIERGGFDLEIIGHDKEINGIKEALLQRRGGNAIVVGEPGVGKNTVVMGFAKKILEGKTDSILDFRHVIKIDTDSILSGVESPGELTERLSGVLNEASSAGNIIVFIENIENLLSSGDVGKIDAGQVILPFLDSSEMHIVGTCSTGSFNKFIGPNSFLSQHFSRVTVDEPSRDEMVRILEDTVSEVEYQTGSLVSYEAILETISSADKYIVDIPNPEKSISLLDGAVAHTAGERGKTIISPKDISRYVAEKYDIPTAEVNDEEKKKLLSLESIMHKNVVGQAEAIAAISNALRRVRAGVTDSKKPIGSFLFLGPTGVGKTETSKALAEAYFGGKDRMVRFDMSEYQNKEDIYHLIGSNQGEVVQGILTTAVREQPFSLLLFDEIEKAHKDILDLFLQILDEGFVTDGDGRKVIFTNTIIIATSNAGANLIRESIQNGIEYEKVKRELLDFIQHENIYRPEFLNRFSGIIAFAPLSRDEILQIAQLMIVKLKKTVFANKGIKLEISQDAVSTLSSLGFDPQMGARPMARVIEEKVENLLATKILSGELKKGDSIIISANDIK